jgi:VanZ family protein
MVCAFADEAHQSTIPSRTGSARDLVIDAFGATAMLTIARNRQTAGDRAGALGGAVAEPAD